MLVYFGDGENLNKSDLDRVLHRAGVRLFWREQTKTYIAESHFVPRFSAEGPSKSTALKLLGDNMQNAENWFSIAHEFLSLDKITSNTADFKDPMKFWLEIVLPIFANAYVEPKNINDIRRVYAFAEWCMWQRYDSKALSTCSMITFYENIPSNPSALLDLPNWVSFEELEKSFLLDSPFMIDEHQRILNTYEGKR